MSRAIHFVYEPLNPKWLKSIQEGQQATAVPLSGRLQGEPVYFKMGLQGSSPNFFLRDGTLRALERALSALPSECGLMLFDGFRSLETQRSLFQHIYHQIEREHEDWPAERVRTETRKFVADPYDRSHFLVPPHNSGGAVDLTLTRRGIPAAMGTGFDDPADRAATDYFESEWNNETGFTEAEWISVRESRRILFHAMRDAGFVNYRAEWWHYDLGDGIWAREMKLPAFYDSMESLVARATPPSP